MDKVHPDSTPMIGRSLDPRKDPFRPKDDDENVLEAEVLYLKCNRRIIVLSSMHKTRYLPWCELVRPCSAPTQCHWIGVKTIFRYLKGTIDMGLFYPYRESLFAAVEWPGHPDEYWLSAIRARYALEHCCTHQASGRGLAVRTDYMPGSCRTRQASGRVHSVRTDCRLCRKHPIFPNSCDVLEGFCWYWVSLWPILKLFLNGLCLYHEKHFAILVVY